LTNVDAKSHWENVYRTKKPEEVSWYRPHLDVSLQLIEEASPNRDAQIIDVGGGESTLVDDLLSRGYSNISVLDVSSTALAVAQGRLGDKTEEIDWLCGDVTTFGFARHQYDVWHDRAVFHFLIDTKDRVAYVRQVARAVKPGGHVIVASFGPEGPTKCSGLDVVRYGADALHDEFGSDFQLVKHLTELHQTPAGSIQQFTYCYLWGANSYSSRERYLKEPTTMLSPDVMIKRCGRSG
jgi:ubiquinone/menaquinone biosynthesis C-methylase UbiE